MTVFTFPLCLSKYDYILFCFAKACVMIKITLFFFFCLFILHKPHSSHLRSPSPHLYFYCLLIYFISMVVPHHIPFSLYFFYFFISMVVPYRLLIFLFFYGCPLLLSSPSSFFSSSTFFFLISTVVPYHLHLSIFFSNKIFIFLNRKILFFLNLIKIKSFKIDPNLKIP